MPDKKHTQYGQLVDSGIPDEHGGTEGIVKMKGCVNMTANAGMPSRIGMNENVTTGKSNGYDGFLALQIEGDVLGQGIEPETLTVTFVIPWLDVGGLMKTMLSAAERAHSAGDPHALQDVLIGMKAADDQSDD